MRGGFIAPVAARGDVVYLTDWSTDLTHTRALEATYWDPATRKLTVYAVNVPRILGDGSYYTEGARTNLVAAHDAFVSESTPGAGVANAGDAPDGTTTADERTAIANLCYVQNNFAASVGVEYACSIFAKYVAGDPEVRLIGVGGISDSVTFDALVNWQREYLTTTAVSTATAGLRFQEFGVNDDGRALVWGWQSEAAGFASQLIRTALGADTRPADVAYIPNANIPSDLIGASGSSPYVVPLTMRRASTEAGDTALEHILYLSANDRLVITSSNTIRVDSGGVAVVESGALTWSADQKIRLTIDPVFGTLAVSGATTGDGTTVGTGWEWTPGASDLYVGCTSAGGESFFGAIGRIEQVDITGAPPTLGLTQYLNAGIGVTVDGSNRMTAWLDQHTSGNDAAGPVADAAKPVLADHGILGAVLRHDGVDDFVVNTGHSMTGDYYTIYIFGDFTTPRLAEAYIADWQTGRFVCRADSALGEMGVGTSSFVASAVSTSLNGPQVLRYVSGSTDASATKVYRDGVQVGPNGTNTAVVDPVGGTAAYMARYDGGAFHVGGDLKLVLAYEGAHTEAQAARVEAFIASIADISGRLDRSNLRIALESFAGIIDSGIGRASDWRDRSGQKRHATMANTNNRPVIVTDGPFAKAVRANGINHHFDVPDVSTTDGNWTCIIVCSPDVTGVNMTPIDSQTGRTAMQVTNAFGFVGMFDGGSRNIAPDAAGLQVLTFTQQPAGTGLRAYRGRTFLGGTTSLGNAFGGTTNILTNYLASAAFFDGDLAALYLINAYLTEAQLDVPWTYIETMFPEVLG